MTPKKRTRTITSPKASKTKPANVATSPNPIIIIPPSEQPVVDAPKPPGPTNDDIGAAIHPCPSTNATKKPDSTTPFPP